jgi:hypothetical protein
MAFERAPTALHTLIGAVMLCSATPLFAQAPTALPPIEADGLLRNVNTPSPTTWRPNAEERQVPLDLFSAYRTAMATGDMLAAYAMWDPAWRKTTSQAEFASSERPDWARGRIGLTRQTWYPAPAGQPYNLYVAIDYVALLADGRFACGFLMTARAAETGNDFVVTSAQQTYIAASLLDGRLPEPTTAALLPCWLGEDVRTLHNP